MKNSISWYQEILFFVYIKNSIFALLSSKTLTTAIQLVWLTGLRAQPYHSPQQQCNQ